MVSRFEHNIVDIVRCKFLTAVNGMRRHDAWQKITSVLDEPAAFTLR